MKIFSIHDSQGEYFHPPFFAKTSGMAQRMFIGSMGDSFPHRADFALYQIGEFDEDTGVITPQDPLRVLAGLAIPADLDPRLPNPATLQTEPQREGLSS